MALPNRVDPLGRLFASGDRGRWLGNRGGRFHDPQTRLTVARPYATRAWICCQLSFRNRRRTVWGHGYTELFFADEVSALAAGHRPCFECRREDATAFAAAWGRARRGPPPTAPEMDAALHDERIGTRPVYAKRLHPMREGPPPDGTMALIGGEMVAFDAGGARRWSYSGFGPVTPCGITEDTQLITPPSIVAVLAAGYRPAWRFAATD